MIHLGRGYDSLVISHDDNFILSGDNGGSKIAKIDLRSYKITLIKFIDSPGTIAITQDNKHAFVV